MKNKIEHKRRTLILFIGGYNINSNGDPGNENKPRADGMSEFSLKRKIRDEYALRGHKILYVKTIDNDGNVNSMNDRIADVDPESCRDVMSFGATIPKKKLGKQEQIIKSRQGNIPAKVFVHCGGRLIPFEVRDIILTSCMSSKSITESNPNRQGTFGHHYVCPESLEVHQIDTFDQTKELWDEDIECVIHALNNQRDINKNAMFTPLVIEIIWKTWRINYKCLAKKIKEKSQKHSMKDGDVVIDLTPLFDALWDNNDIERIVVHENAVDEIIRNDELMKFVK